MKRACQLILIHKQMLIKHVSSIGLSTEKKYQRMNKIVLHSLLFVAVFSFFSCGESQQESQEKILRLENETAVTYDTLKLRELLHCYDQYIADYKEDSLVPIYLFRSAEVYRALGEGANAINTYNLIIERYPQSEYIAECYFLRALVFEEVIYDLAAARMYYRDFIEKYPDHIYAEDALLSLQYLGKSIDEIIESFGNASEEDTIA